MESATRFFISGRVQGVFFRSSTRDQALRLGVQGHARNLKDGRVEVLAAGTADAVNELGRWLQRGPPQAHVALVECEIANATDAASGVFLVL